MNTGERRKLIVNTFNHHMDGTARAKDPGLTEQERFENAMAELRAQGLEDLDETDFISALANAENAHIKRTFHPARGAGVIPVEQAQRANQVVEGILDMFIRHKGGRKEG